MIPLTAGLLRLAGEIDRDPRGAKFSNISPLLIAPGLSFAAVDGGYLLGAGGVIQNWPGRAEAWMRVTTFARPRQIVAALCWVRFWFDRLQRDRAFRRLELHVRADVPYANSQARALGFELPGHVQHAWGPDGNDYIEFERVRN